jgi:hypothetical protein
VTSLSTLILARQPVHHYIAASTRTPALSSSVRAQLCALNHESREEKEKWVCNNQSLVLVTCVQQIKFQHNNHKRNKIGQLQKLVVLLRLILECSCFIDKMIFTYKNTLQKQTMQLTSSTPGARSKNNNRRNKLLSWVYVVRRNRGPTFPAICTTLDAARAYGLCRADAARHGRYR